VTRRNWAFDITVAAVVLILGQLEAWWGIDASHRQGPLWAQATLYAITSVTLVFRRVRPIGCLVVIIVVSWPEFVIFGSPEGTAVALPSVIITYTIARRLPVRTSWWGLLLAFVLGIGWAGFDPNNHTWHDRLLSLFWMSSWLVAWLFGALMRVTRLYAEQRRATRAQRESRAVAEERNRIARELHDVIGHSVSVMTVQTSAVRRRLRPDQALERQTLETVEAVGREALAEMRRMVGVLRVGDEGTGREPPPGLDQLDRLAEKFRASGLPVAVTVRGQARTLAPGLDLTAYRLIQEALTNTLRHAEDPGCAEVSVEYGRDRLTLSVRDRGHPARVSGSAPGTGLLGMKERVAVYGGDLITRSRAEGGFELLATLPLEVPR
jgi:signal transduction histidine kinase